MLDGRYRDEHLMELRCCFKKTTELPPLPTRKHVRGRRPHDPAFDVRTAMYLMLGLDLTAMEGLGELNALTLISELGTDMAKWIDCSSDGSPHERVGQRARGQFVVGGRRREGDSRFRKRQGAD